MSKHSAKEAFICLFRKILLDKFMYIFPVMLYVLYLQTM